MAMQHAYPTGRAKSFLLTVGIMVPVDEADEADEADEESSSVWWSTGSSVNSSVSSSSSSPNGSSGTGGRLASLVLAKDLWRSLMLTIFISCWSSGSLGLGIDSHGL